MSNKRRLQWGILGAAIALVVVMSIIFSNRESATVCAGIEVELEGNEDNSFVGKAEVWAQIRDSMGELEGLPIKKISLAKIEQHVEQIPYVLRAEVYTSLDNKIHVRLEQRNPIVRVHPDGKKPYYIDEIGTRFPLSPHYTARVMIATGDIDSAMSKKIYTLATHVNRLSFWKAQIEQIFVGEERDLVLVEKYGDHRIVIGEPEDIDEKLEKVEMLYAQALKPKGWERYSTINVKFKNQIICK